jgi:RNA polymerase sigma factor (sigma-70 family)
MKDIRPRGVVKVKGGRMSDNPTTRNTLIAKLHDPADAHAWREFLEIYEPLVYRLARNKGLQHADAQDVCQDVFRAVARAVDRWEPDAARGAFRGWLYTIARNLCINFLTRRDRFVEGSGDCRTLDFLASIPASEPGASFAFDTEYRRRLFRWAAEQVKGEFTPNTWQAFWQTAVDERPATLVAAELGMTTGAVYIARSRVISRLRRRIEELGDETAARIGGNDDLPD